MVSILRGSVNRLHKALTVGATLIAYEGWLYSQQERTKNQVSYDTIQNVNAALEDLKVSMEKETNEEVKASIKDQISGLSENLKQMETLYHEVKDKIQLKGTSPQSNLEKALDLNIKEYHEKMGKLIEANLKRTEELEKFLRENGYDNKFIEDNPILKLISDFKEYVSTLSFYDLCILIDLLLAMFIFTCLISILFAFYGNFLIEKLSLEKKYPKLSGIIKLRVKLQHYYIIINSLFIFIALIVMSYVNLMTLITP
jgi:hypothetical protein